VPITDLQKEQRKHTVGASDLAAIFGLSAFQTGFDVQLAKTGQLPDTEENEAMKRGQYLERAVLDYAEDTIGEPLWRNQRRVCKDIPMLAANCDALVKSNNQPVEAKSCRMHGLYGEDESDVPVSVLLQTHAQMLCTETEMAWVPVIVANLELRMYRVRLNKRMADLIRRVVPAWWEHCVVGGNTPTVEFYEQLGLKGIDPLACAPSPAVMRQIIPSEGKIVHLPVSLAERVQEYEELKEQSKALEKRADGIKGQIVAALGDAEVGVMGEKSIRAYRQTEPKEISYVKQPGTTFRFVKTQKQWEQSESEVNNGL
jgi:putative phage-type endonuclease